MPKYIEAVKAAEIIAERTKCNIVYLVDWFCEIASEDVKPVVHAHWELCALKDFWKCSECGETIFSKSEEDRNKYHRFCGRCGAKMDES